MIGLVLAFVGGVIFGVFLCAFGIALCSAGDSGDDFEQ